jgi:hypothetical protein
MRNEQDQPLYNLWRLASRNGYSLRLEGDYIRLVPLTTQGDAGLPRTFRWTNNGIKTARAWLELRDPPRRTGAVNSGRE